MNKQKLVGIMHGKGDTQETLAIAIGISLQRFNAKINETGGAEFTQGEIQCIKERYTLTPEEVDEIFLSRLYLKSVHYGKDGRKNEFCRKIESSNA